MLRRSFLATTSLGAAALAAPGSARAQRAAPSADARDVPRHAQDAWYDALPGKHRLFVDSTTIAEAGTAVGFAWNFLLSSKTGYNLKDADQGVIVCLRHHATVVAFSNDVWRKYDALRTLKYQHPESEKKVKGGNVFRPGSEHPESMSDAFTLDGLAKRGVHFAICGLATHGMAGRLAGTGAGRERVEEIMDELVKSLSANSHVMASGILAAQRAGEYGYTVLRG
ncbi:MAG: hypothetical protein ACYC7F_09480 [Gemmatimonadaceae bacterium]